MAADKHVDYGMALFSALSAGVALMSYCVLWIALGWEGGGNGAMMAAVTAAFFAAQDDPAPSMVSFLVLSLIHISEPTRREWLSRMPSSA